MLLRMVHSYCCAVSEHYGHHIQTSGNSKTRVVQFEPLRNVLLHFGFRRWDSSVNNRSGDSKHGNHKKAVTWWLYRQSFKGKHPCIHLFFRPSGYAHHCLAFQSYLWMFLFCFRFIWLIWAWGCRTMTSACSCKWWTLYLIKLRLLKRRLKKFIPPTSEVSKLNSFSDDLLCSMNFRYREIYTAFQLIFYIFRPTGKVESFGFQNRRLRRCFKSL